MIPRTLTTTAVVTAAFALAASAAWGSEPVRDHGDAAKAQVVLQSQSSPVTVGDHGDAGKAQFAVQSLVDIARDHGDAAQAKLSLQSAPIVARERSQRVASVRDDGDAMQARLEAQTAAAPSAGQLESTSSWNTEWTNLGIGVGLGILLALGVGLTVRIARGYRLAH